jgi:hypothetical protein
MYDTVAKEFFVKDWHFKVFYDGECPFCRLEARWLSYLGRSGQLAVEDIAAPGFDPARYGSTLPELMGTLHGVSNSLRLGRVRCDGEPGVTGGALVFDS